MAIISLPLAVTGISNIAVSGGTSSANLSAITFANGNGVSFGLNGSTMTASHNALTSQSNQAISGANGSSTFQTVSFANSNGLSWSTGTQGFFGSHNGITSQSNQQITAFATSNTTQSTSGTFNANSIIFAGAGGVSVGVSNGSVVISGASGGAGDGFNRIAAGTQTAGTLATVNFADSNGITFGMSGSTQITASHNGLTSQSNQAVSAANGSSTFQTLSVANGAVISFSTAAGGLVPHISASIFAAGNTTSSSSGLMKLDNFAFFGAGMISVGAENNTVKISATQSAQELNAFAVSQTTLQTSGSLLPTSIFFAGAGAVSVGVSNGSVVISGASAAGDGLNRIAAGTQTAGTMATIHFGNSNGITFGMSNSTQVTASHNGITSQSNQQMTFFATSNTTQSSTMTANASSLIFAGAGVASVGMTNGSVVISVPSGGGGLTNINISAGTTSNNLSQLVFSDGSGVTFGLNSNTITASVNAGGAGPTLSMYPNLPHAWATSSMFTGASTTVAGGSSSTLSWYVAPLILPAAVTFNDVKAILSVGATIAGTGSGTHRHVLGIYTRNASTMSLLTSFAWNAVHSQSSVTAQTLSWWNGAFSHSTAASTLRISGNVSASISGLHEIRANATSSASSLSAGHYFLAHAYNFRSSSSALFQMGSAWRHSVSQFTGAFGFSNTSGPLMGGVWNGIVSTVTTTPTQFEWVAPASIHSSAITATGGTSLNQWPLVILQSATV